MKSFVQNQKLPRAFNICVFAIGRESEKIQCLKRSKPYNLQFEYFCWLNVKIFTNHVRMITLNEEPWVNSKKNSLKFAKLSCRKNGFHLKFAISFWYYGIFKISAFGHGSKKLKTNLPGSTFIGMECVCLACVDSARGRVFEEDLQIETIEAQTWRAEI